MATNYSSLSLFTQSNSVLPYAACYWVAVSGNVRFEAFFYSNFANSILCQDQSVNSEVKWNTTCSITGGIVYTSLTIISPLQAGLWKISVECQENESSVPEEKLSIKIDVSGKIVLFYNCLI